MSDAVNILLAVDPGNISGVAYFANGELVWAGTVKRGTPRDWQTWIHPRITAVAIERPQIYRPRLSKGDPNTLAPLLMQVGWLEMLAAQHYAAFNSYLPQEWKGQLPKDVCANRIASRLRGFERMPLDHNAIDAVGIGLFHLRRL